MLLENEEWQKIPGSVNTWIFPQIRKTSITGSNTFIIRNGNRFMVIDPGATPDQMEKTREEIKKHISDSPPLILVIAGHIHIDHIYLGLVDRTLWDLGTVLIVAEDQGASWLEKGDTLRTGANLIGVSYPPVQIGIHLLTPSDKKPGAIRRIAVSGHEDLILTSHVFEYDGRKLYGQSILLDDSDQILFWHTPGHSDDSLTIRIGSLFHVGDIPFSNNPGIAGIIGYNRDKLLVSVLGIRDMFIREGGRICCPGHGRTLDRESTISLFDRMIQDTSSMPEPAVFDEKRLHLSMWHGLDLIEEAHRIFPVISGRLMFLSFQLEELGLEEEAQLVWSIFDCESVDNLLDEFNQYYREYQSGKKVKPEIVQKLLQILKKIQSSFPAELLRGVIDIALIRRADRLFTDFLGTVQGILPACRPEETLLILLIRDFIDGTSSAVISDNEMIRLADDENGFRKAMMNRLAFYAHQRKFMYRLLISDDAIYSIPVQVDRERFCDFLSGLTEYFESIEVQNVEISVTVVPDATHIVFTPKGYSKLCERRIPGATMREVAYAGGMLLNLMEPGREDIRISFPISR